MLPEDAPKNPTPDPSPSAGQSAPPKPDDIRIDGKIGTDPDELKRWADHVVAGKPIEHMEIADLRALIEAVQAHPGAKLAPERERGELQQTEVNLATLTQLEIEGGVVLGSDYRALDLRITLHASTIFREGATFRGATLRGDAWFGDATFGGPAWFRGATLRGGAWFAGATFRDEAMFDSAIFEGETTFFGATFEGGASFAHATFRGGASFADATFRGKASFRDATFDGPAWLDRAIFKSEASFNRATFGGRASFEGADFKSEASFNRATFEGGASFEGADFKQDAPGDFRSVDVSKARASLEPTERRVAPWITMEEWKAKHVERIAQMRARRERPWDDHPRSESPWQNTWTALATPGAVLQHLWREHRKNRAFWRVLGAMIRARLAHGSVDWSAVRSLGRLSILNRVSLVALIAVPVLVAAYLAARKIVPEAGSEGLPIWIRWMVRAIGDILHLDEMLTLTSFSKTLALTFFASVFVTIGLLIYQKFAPDTIKQRDEDEHVRDVEARYSDENPSLRGDGLRRSIERLEDQAKVRAGRHPSFVRHHGDTIWIPPRNRPEWFKDDDLKAETYLSSVRESLRHQREAKELPTDDAALDEEMTEMAIVLPMQRPGFVPGAERARICIEEGARAEYWLKSHEEIAWAWLSLICYLLGIAILLVILFIQCRNVARAAWWPEAMSSTLSSGTRPSIDN